MSSTASNNIESDNANEKRIDHEENSDSFFDNEINYSFETLSQNENQNTKDMLLTKNNVNVFELPIEDIIDRRDRYIAELKLEKAQELDAIIDYMQSIAPRGPIQKVKDYLTSKFNEYYEQYQENCQNSKADSDENEMEIRRVGDEYFVEMKSRHINQLVEIEKMRAYELIFNKNKPVQKANVYEQQARYSAQQKEYDKAYHFRQQASQEREKVQNERRAIVEEKMSNLKTNILMTMKNEMKVLSDKIKSQIESNQALYNDELDAHLKSFKVLVSSETQKAIVGLNKYFTKNETKKLLAMEISSFATSKLKEITGIDMNITYSPQPSPKSKKTQTQTTSASPSPSHSKKQPNSPKQQKSPNSPKQQKTQKTAKQTNSTKQEQTQNQQKTISDAAQIIEEEEEQHENDQQLNEQVEDQKQQQQHKEEEEPKEATEAANNNEKTEEVANNNEKAEDAANNNEKTEEVATDLNADADGTNNDNSVDIDNILNEAGNGDNKNDEDLNFSFGENDNAIPNEKSATDSMLDKILNGEDDDDLLAGLDEGNSNKQKDNGILNSDSILNLGED